MVGGLYKVLVVVLGSRWSGFVLGPLGAAGLSLSRSSVGSSWCSWATVDAVFFWVLLMLLGCRCRGLLLGSLGAPWLLLSRPSFVSSSCLFAPVVAAYFLVPLLPLGLSGCCCPFSLRPLLWIPSSLSAYYVAFSPLLLVLF